MFDSNGVTHSLSEYKGKFVVLEWANKGCPYEQKHYLSGNMESLQKQWTDKGVVWLSILSSAPGQQGYMTPAEENDYLKTMKASPTAALLDPTGAIGHLFDRADDAAYLRDRYDWQDRLSGRDRRQADAGPSEPEDGGQLRERCAERGDGGQAGGGGGDQAVRMFGEVLKQPDTGTSTDRSRAVPDSRLRAGGALRWPANSRPLQLSPAARVLVVINTLLCC